MLKHGKKKTDPVVYTPISNTSNVIPQIEIQAIPPYEDQGVRYQGYSKKKVGEGQYNLYPQLIRIQVLYMDSSNDPSTSITRLDPTKTFYVSSIHVDAGMSLPNTGVILGDGASNKPRMTFVLTAGEQHFDLDVSGSPRDFRAPTITMDLDSAMLAGDYCQIALIGWVE